MRFLILLVLFLVPCVTLRAEDADSKRLFVFETSEESASESLERISGGEYDLGFSAPSQSFDSPDHYTPGPMGRQKSYEQSSGS